MKHPVVASKEEDSVPEKHILIVDMGHVSTSVAAVKMTGTYILLLGLESMFNGLDSGAQVLATRYSQTLSCRNFDYHIARHFAAEIKATHGIDVFESKKKRDRLTLACSKLKHLLSTASGNQKSGVTVENLGQDCDIPLSMSRPEFEALCSAEKEELATMLRSLMEESQLTPDVIESVEIVGGGTRIPLIQTVIAETIHDRIGRRLDGTTAVAVGAAAFDVAIDQVDPATRSAWPMVDAEIETEATMVKQDLMIAQIAEVRNGIESFIYDMRSKASSNKHGKKIDTAILNPILNDAEDWMYSEEAENADLERMMAKAKELRDVSWEKGDKNDTRLTALPIDCL